MDIPTGTAAQIDGQAMLAEAWDDIFAAKIGLAQMLTLDVIFRYSLALNRAAAWIPNLGVFKGRTGMGEKETGLVLRQLESYGMLEWEDAKAMNVLPQGNFPDGRFYLYFPRRVRAWSIAPRVPNRQLLEEAAIIDRWLLAFNADGGPEGVDLFPPHWGHADTLAEWRRADEPPLVSPALPTQSAQPPFFSRSAGSGSAMNPDEASENEVLGKNPKLGEKPQATPLNEWNALNERQVSHLNQTRTLNERPLGKNPKRPALESDARLRHWPTIEKERALMRQLNQMVDAWYAPAKAAEVKEGYGANWRWRIREYPFAVEQAMMVAQAQWKEIRVGLGQFLNARWLELWNARPARTRAAELEEAVDPATVRAEIAASLGGSEE